MSISVTVSGEDSTSVVLTQALSDTVTVSETSAISVQTQGADSASVIVIEDNPTTIKSNDLTLFLKKSETGAFYPTSNPSGFITGVDLSELQTATGNLNTRVNENESDILTVSGLITSNDGDISALQTATGLLVQKSETGNFVTDSDTGAFYPTLNPSGFITGVDLSSYVQDSETGLFLVSGEDAVINTLGVGDAPDANIDLHVKSTSAKFLVENTLAGGEWVRFSAGTVGTSMKFSNTASFGIGPVASKTDQNVVNDFYMNSAGNIDIGTDAPSTKLHVNGALQIGSTPTYSFSRSIKLLDDGVQYGARVSLVGTDDDGYPGLEMVTDGNLSKRTLIRHEGEGSNDYGLSFYTTNNSVVSESVRFNGDGSVGIGTSSPSEKLDVRGDALISGVLNIRDISQNSNKSITADGNNLTFSNVHGIFGYSIGLRGDRGSTLGMESAGSILDISAPSDITLTPGGVTDIQSDLNVYGNTITTGDLTVSGNSFFQNRPTVNGTGVLLSGEGGGGAVENVVYTTGDQEVSGIKNFSETLKAGKITLSENSFVTETGNFTISSTHRGATVLLQNSNPITVTVPAQVSGHVTTFIAETSSAVLFATGAGISGLNSFGGANQIAGIFGQAQIIFKSNEYAFLGGNIA
jgi:hypothetical protein